jgi:epoxyqueuosine reductase
MGGLSLSETKNWLHQRTKEMGFAAFGIAKVGKSTESAQLLSWMERGFHGEMDWFERNLETRLNAEKLLPGSKSILCFADSYLKTHHLQEIKAGESPLVAKYAQGLDYHKVLKDRMHLLVKELKVFFPKLKARVIADSAPVMEHYWAKKAGLGWIGKHSLLITNTAGSYVYLGEVFLDLDFEADEEKIPHCGTCKKCITACPTGAIVEEYVVDARKCISYLTIEKKGNFSENEKQAVGEHLVGCDICQDVCPWNHKDSWLSIKKPMNYTYQDHVLEKTGNPALQEFEVKEEEDFEKKFSLTSLNRLGNEKLARNVEAVKSHKKNITVPNENKL